MAELRLENSIVDDRYQVDRCLGRGSYAEVFLAYDRPPAADPVIIKALNTTLQGTPDAELERTLVENFQNEALALDAVRHPHIIRRLGHGTAADLEGVAFHYLVLEYMPGGDMLTLCRKRPMRLDEVLFYFEQVSEALAYAHNRQVIHRDIKPNNLLLSADQRVVKIADFGVAKMNHDDRAEITRVGTNVYAPPEHHPDSPADTADSTIEKLTPSADVYSLAKTIYTAVTGRAPRQFARLPIAELPSELASERWRDDLLRVLTKATASRVGGRYQSVQEFWSDLARLAVFAAPEGEADPDATLVRSRLSATSRVASAESQPVFHTLGNARVARPPQRARIVVELPEQPRRETASAERSPEVERVAAGGGIVVDVSAPAPPGNTQATRVEVGDAAALSTAASAAARPSRRRYENRFEPTVFDRLQTMVGSDWLRRAFIIFLVVALVGLVATTYFEFASRGRDLTTALTGTQRDGVIANAPNVNLRSEPRGEVRAVLPRGTRVRVLESSGGWARIIVLEWLGAPPDNAPSEGWVDSGYIRETTNDQ